MSNVPSILEEKHKVIIDFPANYILPLKKPSIYPLKNVTRCLDQVSTFLLVLCFDA